MAVEEELRSIYDRVTNDSLIGKNKAYVSDHIEFLNGNGKRKRTQIKHLYHIRRFYRLLENPKIDWKKLTKQDIQSALNKLQNAKSEKGTPFSPEVIRNVKTCIKSFWKHLKGADEFYPAEVRWIETSQDVRNKKLPKDLLTEDDVLKMIDCATSMRNKAFIALLYDTGARSTELLTMPIKSVNLDTTPAHILLPDGKTSERKIPIMFSPPYLAQYLSLIKHKKPEDPLWTVYNNGDDTGRQADYATIRKMLIVVAKKAGVIHKVNPHNWRHSRASQYANKLTDRQMMAYFGWKSADTIKTYVHLSGRDIDNAIMQANDQLPKESTKSKLVPKVCPRCQQSNMTTAFFCSRCGNPIDVSTATNIAILQNAATEVAVEPERLEDLVQKLVAVELKKREKTKSL